MPTLTPTPAAAPPATADDSSVAAAQPAAAAAAPASDPLAAGRLLLRYGDYAAARTALNQVAADAAMPPDLRAAALYDVGRA